jgi:hypothetical protein
VTPNTVKKKTWIGVHSPQPLIWHDLLFTTQDQVKITYQVKLLSTQSVAEFNPSPLDSRKSQNSSVQIKLYPRSRCKTRDERRFYSTGRVDRLLGLLNWPVSLRTGAP